MNQAVCAATFLSFQKSCIIHCLPDCRSKIFTLSPSRFQQCCSIAEGGEDSTEGPPPPPPPPSAAANDGALPGLERSCVKEIYTHNTPGAPGAAPRRKPASLHHFLYDSWRSGATMDEPQCLFVLLTSALFG